jgi:ATP-dependent protease ClpP protease subunit
MYYRSLRRIKHTTLGKRPKLFTFFLTFFLFLSFSSYAAKQSFFNGIISITGTIDNVDFETFQKLLDSHKGHVSQVYLNSPGGNIIAAVRIGGVIRNKKLHTVVIAKDRCASACGLIWLGGTQRTIEPTGSVGFHASYQIKDGIKRESGQSNAIIGAYLNSLGLSLEAVLFVTQSPPNKITWLSESEAKRVGITYDTKITRAVKYNANKQLFTKDFLEAEFSNIPLVLKLKAEFSDRYDALWKLFLAEIESNNSLEVARLSILKSLYPYALTQAAKSSDNVIHTWKLLHNNALKSSEKNNPTACILMHYGNLDLANTLSEKSALLDFYDTIILDKNSPINNYTPTDVEDAYANSFRVALWRSSEFQKLISKNGNNMALALDAILKPTNDTEKHLLCKLMNGAYDALSGTYLEGAYYRELLKRYTLSNN